MFGLSQLKEILQQIKDINTKIDKHSDDTDARLDNIEKVMIAQEINLQEHMKRSEHLEEMLNHVKDNELKPLTKHAAMVEGALKLVGVLGIIVGIAGTVAKIFGMI